MIDGVRDQPSVILVLHPHVGLAREGIARRREGGLQRAAELPRVEIVDQRLVGRGAME